MAPETSEDWLDRSLTARHAATAPPEFTAAVMRRVADERLSSPPSRFWMEEGFRVGLTLAAAGVCWMVDMDRLGMTVNRELQAASPVVLAAVVLGISAAWLSVKTSETA